MTLRDVKKLQCGDKFRRPSKNEHDNGWRVYFRRPSKNEHDNGWRVYTVTGRTVDASGLYGKPGAVLGLTVRDQHGYVMSVNVYAWDRDGSKEFMATAERVK